MNVKKIRNALKMSISFAEIVQTIVILLKRCKDITISIARYNEFANIGQ